MAAPNREKQPECRAWAFTGADDTEQRRRQWQQPNENDRMRRGHMLQRQRGQQGKADHHAKRDDDQGQDVALFRARLAHQRQRQPGKTRRDDGPCRGQKKRREIRDRNPCRGQ